MTQENDREKLTEKQRRFVLEYLKDGNAARAYRDAGYTVKNDRVAEVEGSRNLRKPSVAAAIAAARSRITARLELSAERVLLEAQRILFSDPRRYYRPDGTLKPLAELGDDEAAALAELEVFEELAGSGPERKLVGHTRKIKLWNKLAALDKLMRHLGLLNDKIELLGKGGEALRIIHDYDSLRHLPPDELRRRHAESLGGGLGGDGETTGVP